MSHFEEGEASIVCVSIMSRIRSPLAWLMRMDMIISFSCSSPSASPSHLRSTRPLYMHHSSVPRNIVVARWNLRRPILLFGSGIQSAAILMLHHRPIIRHSHPIRHHLAFLCRWQEAHIRGRMRARLRLVRRVAHRHRRARRRLTELSTRHEYYTTSCSPRAVRVILTHTTLIVRLI